jgi:cytochrome b6-f complex iron-sulfur subunit
MPDTSQPQPGTKRITRRALSLVALREGLKFVTALRLGWTAFVASSVAATAATFRFFFPNVLFEPPSSMKVGYPSEYNEVGQVYTQWKQKGGFWLVRTAEGIYALSTVCTHLGCTPNWLAMERKFKCPCHGSGFHRSGINFEGPAPRPLERFRIVLAEDGQVLVDKSKKYQQEKGQWDELESFLEV